MPTPWRPNSKIISRSQHTSTASRQIAGTSRRGASGVKPTSEPNAPFRKQLEDQAKAVKASGKKKKKNC